MYVPKTTISGFSGWIRKQHGGSSVEAFIWTETERFWWFGRKMKWFVGMRKMSFSDEVGWNGEKECGGTRSGGGRVKFGG